MPDDLNMSRAFSDEFYEELWENLRTRPMTVLVSCQKAHSITHSRSHQALYQQIGIIAGFAKQVESEPPLKKELYNHHAWDLCKHHPKPTEPIRTATRSMTQGFETSSNEYDRALDYANAIEYLFSTNVQPPNIWKELAALTIEGVLDLKRQSEETKDPQPDPPPTPTQDPDAGVGRGNGTAGAKAEPSHVGRKGAQPSKLGGEKRKSALQHAGRGSPNYPFNVNDEIALKAGPFLEEILNINEDEMACIICRRVRDRDEWKQFEVLAVSDATSRPRSRRRPPAQSNSDAPGTDRRARDDRGIGLAASSSDQDELEQLWRRHGKD